MFKLNASLRAKLTLYGLGIFIAGVLIPASVSALLFGMQIHFQSGLDLFLSSGITILLIACAGAFFWGINGSGLKRLHHLKSLINQAGRDGVALNSSDVSKNELENIEASLDRLLIHFSGETKNWSDSCKSLQLEVQSHSLNLTKKTADVQHLEVQFQNLSNKRNNFNSALLELRDCQITSDIKLYYREAVAIISRALEVERVSLWFYDFDKISIECHYIFRLSDGVVDETKVRLSEIDYPCYFAAIKTAESIIANNAILHPATHEFKDGYLIPLNIFSMLDVPLRFGSEVTGVICCEHINNERQWTDDEHNFVITASIFLMLARSEKNLIEINGDLKTLIEKQNLSLLEGETRFDAVVKNSLDAVIILSAQERILFANKKFFELLMIPEQDPGNLVIEDYVAPNYREFLRDQHNRRILGERVPTQFEYQALRSDGNLIWCDVHIETIFQDGKPTGSQSVIRDISERKKVESELLASEERMRQIIETAMDAVITMDAQGFITSWNSRAEIIFGWKREEAIGLKLSETIIPMSSRAAHEFGLRRLANTQKSEVVGKILRMTAVRKCGAELQVELIISFGLLHGQIQFNAFVRDISDKLKAEAEIERLLLIVREIDNAVIITDVTGGVEWVNQGFTRLTGYLFDEIKGRKPSSFLQGVNSNPESIIKMREQIALAKRCEVEIINYSKTGREYLVIVIIQPIFDANGELTGFFSINTDVTAVRKAERIALRTQRLESIGTLAAGVAHDLNNALAPIMMSVDILRLDYPAESGTIDIIESAVKRGAAMVRQLLTFAKGVDGKRVRLDPVELLAEINNLIHSSFPKNLRMLSKISPNLPCILGDSTQLHQVLLNLCLNARDSMLDGGTLTLSALSVEIDSEGIISHPDARLGRYVAFSVNDTGTGIKPEIIEFIFDPFFSTKGLNKGTGLGLSSVMGIVKSHQGFVQVYSQIGEGSVFTVYLPAYVDMIQESDSSGKDRRKFLGHGETVLFVDDESAIREAAGRGLKQLNFKVLTASSGKEALDQVVLHREILRAVITDLHMPNMDGLELVRRLRELLPSLPILVISGRLDAATDLELKALGVVGRLSKPFTGGQLADAMSDLLGQK